MTSNALLSWIIAAVNGEMIPPIDSAMPTRLTTIAKAMFCFITVIVVLPILSSSGILLRSSVARVMPAVSIATSVPDKPIAMPMSASARAGASFMPSPIIATMCPCCFNWLTCVAFSAGIISE